MGQREAGADTASGKLGDGPGVPCVPGNLHGLAPNFTICDEGSQWPVGESDRVYSVLRTSAGKQASSTFIAIGTRSADAGHWFSKRWMGGGLESGLCGRPGQAVCDEVHPGREPHLDHMPLLKKEIVRERAEAQADTAALPRYLVLRLNLGVLDAPGDEPLCAPESWVAIETDRLPDRGGGRCWVGLDLGGSSLMSCAIALFESGRVESFAGFPDTLPLKERERGGQRVLLPRTRFAGGAQAVSGPNNPRSAVPGRLGACA